MSDSGRCPSCGALAAPDARWCGQCYSPLGQAVPPEPAPEGGPSDGGEPQPAAALAPRETGVQTASVPIRREGENLLWDCVTCGQANPMDVSACGRCGTPFAQMLAQEAAAERVLPEPGRALGLSLALTGLGHMVMGRAADGVARLILFLWAIGLGLIMLLSPRNSGPVVGVGALFVLSALGIWAVTAMDAFRLANGNDEQLLKSKVLLVGTIVLTVLSIGAFLAAGLSASQSGVPGAP
jgi:hypothetical protein